MNKILRKTNTGGYNYWCIGCKCVHHLDKRWTLTGTEEKPTIRPSILVPKGLTEEKIKANKILCMVSVNPLCHSFITEGQIQYLQDCEHELKGQTIDMMKF